MNEDSFDQYDLLPASFRYEEKTRNREVFIVTRNSPTTGMIFGCYTSQADADRLVKEINTDPEKWGLTAEDSVGVLKIQQNKAYNYVHIRALT
jgi:hypothetical protein